MCTSVCPVCSYACMKPYSIGSHPAHACVRGHDWINPPVTINSGNLGPFTNTYTGVTTTGNITGNVFYYYPYTTVSNPNPFVSYQPSTYDPNPWYTDIPDSLVSPSPTKAEPKKIEKKHLDHMFLSDGPSERGIELE